MDTRKIKRAAKNDAKKKPRRIKIDVDTEEKLEAYHIDWFEVKKNAFESTCAPKIPNFRPNFG